MCVSLLPSLVSGDPPKRNVITSVPQILELERADADGALPVEVVGTVYYSDPDWNFFFFEQGGVFICVESYSQFLPIGTAIRLSGETRSGHRKNVIECDSITVLGITELGDPIALTMNESIGHHHDCDWITTECTVRSARSDVGRTVLECRTEELEFSVAVLTQMSAETLLPLIESQVRITGNVGSDFDDDVYIGTEICCPVGHIEIVQPADQPVDFVDRRSVEELWNDEHAQDFHLAGHVTFVGKGGMFIENDTSGTWIHNDRAISIRKGMYIDVHGVRESNRQLFARVIRIRGTVPLSQPKTENIDELLVLKPDSKRVRVVGRFLGVRHGGSGALLSMMGSNEVPFCVYLPMTKEQLLSLHLESAVLVSVAGTVSFSEEGPYRFAIYSPSRDEVIVKERKPVMSRWKVLGIFAVIGPLLAFAVIWGYSHRTKSRAHEKDLEQITAELRLSFDSIRDGVLILDRDSRIVHANQKVCDLTGFALSSGESSSRFETSLLERLVDKRFVDDWKRLNRDDTLIEEFSLDLDLSGERHALEVFTAPVKNGLGTPLARMWAFHDVTEKQQLQASLLHAQKQEAIGRLAGGFAHDFNNLLTGVIGSLSVATLDKQKTVGEIIDLLETAEGASERAATLVSQLLGFSRKTRLDLKSNDVNSIIVQMEPLLRPVLKSIHVSYQLDENIPTVRVDATQLEQVLLNICLNACDAIGDYGEVFVCTHTKRIKKAETLDAFVVVSIRDTGPGIDEKIREKIFEPFFTTKQGKGTGLGLAMAEGIVHQHGGWLECDSAIGVGTEFRVFLPACSQRVTALPDPIGKPVGDLTNRVVLVVDDEKVVRQAVAAILGQYGATVHVVSDGEQAIATVRHQTVDLVLLDWTMPQLSGRETLQRIKKLQPSMPVIICSGFAFDVDEITRQASVAPDDVVQKPFNSEKVRQIVLGVLDKAQRGEDAKNETNNARPLPSHDSGEIKKPPQSDASET